MAKKKSIAKAIGRPTLITPEMEHEILGRLVDGESARSICRDKHMPSWRTLCYHKIKPENKDFLHQYAYAKESGVEAKLDGASERSIDESRDYYIDSKGERRSDNTACQRDKLIIDLIKWEASKLFPKQYGDKVAQEISGPEGAPLQLPALKIIIEK